MHIQLALQAQEEQESGYSPLHSCWSALLEQMLTSGHTDAVLRALDAALPSSALLTPQEAHQLVEHSRSMAQEGTSALPASLVYFISNVAFCDHVPGSKRYKHSFSCPFAVWM